MTASLWGFRKAKRVRDFGVDVNQQHVFLMVTAAVYSCCSGYSTDRDIDSGLEILSRPGMETSRMCWYIGMLRMQGYLMILTTGFPLPLFVSAPLFVLKGGYVIIIRHPMAATYRTL